MGPDEPPLGSECDVEQGAGGEEGGEAGHQAPGGVWPLHLHPGHCVTVSLIHCLNVTRIVRDMLDI